MQMQPDHGFLGAGAEEDVAPVAPCANRVVR
jgi:hypothetical protein